MNEGPTENRLGEMGSLYKYCYYYYYYYYYYYVALNFCDESFSQKDCFGRGVK